MVPNGVCSGLPPAYAAPPSAVWHVRQLPRAASAAPRTTCDRSNAAGVAASAACGGRGAPIQAHADSSVTMTACVARRAFILAMMRRQARRSPGDRAGPGLHLHRLEAMRERARDGELLGARLQRDDRLVAPVALDARDRVQVDDRRAVDLPERILVELVVQVLDRLLDQRLGLRRDDLRVLVLGLEVHDVAHRDHLQHVAERGADPLERRGWLATLGEPREQRREVGRWCRETRLDARDDLRDAL